MPVDRTCRIREGGRQDKFTGSAVIFERSHELAAKHPRGSSDRDEEAVSTFTKFEIPGKTGTGDDAVDMRMEGKVLAPCMEYLDDAGLGAKIASVTRQSQKGLGSCLMEQRVEQLLIGKKQRVQIMRNGEYDVEILRIENFRATLIDPELFQDGLAAGTMPVAAGGIVDEDMAAFLADA